MNGVGLQTYIVANFMTFGEKFNKRRRKGIKHLIWIVVVWNARNNVIFRGGAVNVKSIVMVVVYTSWGWFIAKGRNCGVGFSNWFNCPMGCLL